MFHGPVSTSTEQFGIVNVSVANLHRLSAFQSEILDQALLGAVLPIYDYQNDFYLVDNWDHYRGWISKYTLRRVNRQEALQWQADARLWVTALGGWVHEAPEAQSAALSDITLLGTLSGTISTGQYTPVALPDGRSGYIESADISAIPIETPARPNAGYILDTARRFAGIPYYWGGITPKGMDCSGFVQTVFRLCGFPLPRNASQMATLGAPVAVNSDDTSGLRAGDLLFFGNSMERITHVALYMGDSLFMHAEGAVVTHSLQEGHPGFNAYRRDTLIAARRIT